MKRADGEGARSSDDLVRESEERYRLIADSVFEGIFLHHEGRILDVNETACKVLGYTRSELIGRSVLDLIAPESRDLVLGKIRAGDTGPYEAIGLRKDGTRMIGEMRAAYVPYHGRQVRVAAVRDITDQRRSEEARQRSEAGYRDLVQHAVYGIYRSTPDGRIVMANPALVRLLGYESEEELLKLNLGRDVYVDPLERVRVLERVEAEQTPTVEVAWKRADGQVITVRLNGRIVRGESGRDEYYETIVEDVTERRAVEEQLRQVQKLDSIGRLAGGVAHDLNNVLTAVLGYAGLLADGIRAGQPSMDDLDEIVRAAGRARDLTQHLLAFARKQVMQPRIIDPNAVVEDAERMLRRLLTEAISIDLRLAQDVGLIEADPARIEQVIVNLAVNARDAMPNGGALTIETGNVVLDEMYAFRHPGTIQPGPHVMIAVRDTGMGMPRDVIDHIFEPFYTTKAVGKGTGLGLSVVYGIVKQSGGHIWAYSEPGMGSTFRMYFPRAAGALSDTARPVEAEARGGTERVLVVEDDPAVKVIAVRGLESAGYSVRSAGNGAEALALAVSLGEPIDLLLTDVVMPGMSGREVADALCRLWPKLRVLYMSGYTENAIVHHGVLEPGVKLLTKPFSAAALLGKVRDVLDAAADRAV